MLLEMLAAEVQTAFAQGDSRDYNRGWYAGLSGGTSFGQATFRSITESKPHVGAQFGVFGGYQFSRLFSVQAVHHEGCLGDRSRQLWRTDRPLYAMSQNSPTLLPSRETGASPSCLLAHGQLPVKHGQMILAIRQRQLGSQRHINDTTFVTL